MTVNPLNKIIGLSVVLSMGFLLVILAAINGSWFPIIIGLLYAIAHLPIIISNAYHQDTFDEFNETQGGVVEFCKFLSSGLLVSGFSMAMMLGHCHILSRLSVTLCSIGGTLIYGTIVVFSSYFDTIS